MENFDMIFQQMNDISLIQQQLKKSVDETKADQKLISKQVQANGQAVASLTIRQMETEAVSTIQNTSLSIQAKACSLTTSLQTKIMKSSLDHRPSTTRTSTMNSFLTMLCPKCNFLHLTVATPKSGWTIASTTSRFTRWKTI
jgi:F0F1-type ATP synthase membrane subunit b/b'